MGESLMSKHFKITKDKITVQYYMHDSKEDAAERAREICDALGVSHDSHEFECLYQAIHQHEITLTIEVDRKSPTLDSKVVQAQGYGFNLKKG